MQSQLMTTAAFSRLDPETTARIRRGKAGKATRTQTAVEYTLFAVFGTTIVLSLIALIVVNSPQHKLVPNRVAEGLQQGRVNILVMATTTRGGTIDTDSLMLVSVKPNTHQVAVVSIPRDLWVKLGRYGTHRLAAAESVGRSSGYPGEGTGLTADTVERITGQPVHAYVRLDRGDLRATIDAIGGIDIDVKYSFFESKTFDRFRPGVQHMDGARAIRFAKSHAIPGPQGDRFARELREQQVIVAVLQRIEAMRPATRDRLLRNTNLELQQTGLLSMAPGAVQHVSLEPLMNVADAPAIGDAGDVVQPRSGDFRQVQSAMRDVFAPATVAVFSH